jgi:hypothetical protein
MMVEPDPGASQPLRDRARRRTPVCASIVTRCRVAISRRGGPWYTASVARISCERRLRRPHYRPTDRPTDTRTHYARKQPLSEPPKRNLMKSQLAIAALTEAAPAACGSGSEGRAAIEPAIDAMSDAPGAPTSMTEWAPMPEPLAAIGVQDFREVWWSDLRVVFERTDDVARLSSRSLGASEPTGCFPEATTEPQGDSMVVTADGIGIGSRCPSPTAKSVQSLNPWRTVSPIPATCS